MWAKLNRLPVWGKLLLASMMIALVALAIVRPWWLEPRNLFDLIFLGLFCPDFNILSIGAPSCNATFATFVFGGAVIIFSAVILFVVCLKLVKFWRQL